MATGKGVMYAGCIAAQELEKVGAGVEGWMDSSAVSVAIAGDQMAVARGSTVVMRLMWRQETGSSLPPVVAEVKSAEQGQNVRVTALEWIVCDDYLALAVGTSQGTLLLYSEWGTVLLKQHFFSGPILRLRARQDRNVVPGVSTSGDLCIMFSKAIVRIDAVDLQSLLDKYLSGSEKRRDSFRSRRSNSSILRRQPGEDLHQVESLSLQLRFEMWNVSRASAASVCADGALACVLAPPLLEHQLQRHYCALTVGADCTLAAFRVSGDKRSTLAGLLFDKVMPATISTISSLTKRLWRSDPKSETNRPTEVTPQAFGRATLITTVQDKLRKGESLSLSPSGSLATVTDSLGRISLVDVQAVVVVRLWKGYREAHCMFLEAPLDGRAAYGERVNIRSTKCKKDDFSLCLAIHAPRRGVVEVWQMRYGPRLMVIRCSENCMLVQPSCKFNPASDLGGESISISDDFLPAQVYILNGNSGVLSLLNPFMGST